MSLTVFESEDDLQKDQHDLRAPVYFAILQDTSALLGQSSSSPTLLSLLPSNSLASSTRPPAAINYFVQLPSSASTTAQPKTEADVPSTRELMEAIVAKMHLQQQQSAAVAAATTQTPQTTTTAVPQAVGR